MGTLKRRVIDEMEPKEEPPMESKSYTLTVGDVLHNLAALADNYEQISAGKQDGLACDTAAAAANLRAAVQMIWKVPVWIPVSEQLPPEATVVLGWTNRVVFAFFRDGAWVDTLYGWHLPNGPSHWMPLPPPPEVTT